MIHAQSIIKYYGIGESRFQALRGIDLDIAKGESAVILGASGSGKSTLLNILSGLERPDGGNVFYGDEDITTLSDSALTRFRRDNIGFVFQQYYLLSGMTVEKNVRMGADLASNSDYIDIIKAVGLGEKLEKYPSQLSGGEQQRVVIVRAIAKKPKVLFADEPTGALDESTVRQVLNFMLKLQSELGFTLIMVTHNSNIAQTAKTVIKMNSGRIESVTKNDSIKTAFEIGW